MNIRQTILAIGILAAYCGIDDTACLAQDEVSLFPAQDNTLYESATGSLSNGKGQHLFAGLTAQDSRRRALLRFELEGVLPDGATLESVELVLNLSRSIGPTARVTVHRLLSGWGEGSSTAGGNEGQGGPATAGDATWIHRHFPDSMWQEAGGDFAPTPSAETAVAGSGSYTFGPTSELIADVQRWIANPEENYGWIIVGDESTSASAKRFDSGDNSTSTLRPVLRLRVRVATGLDDVATPGRLSLAQNYPNPFDRATTVEYGLTEFSDVRFEVVDLSGRVAWRHHAGVRGPGAHVLRIDASDLSPGWYIYRMIAGREFRQRPLTVLR